ncbi:MAG: hypothetical protein ACJ75J_05110 [Cytophagaceae bacterium]|jgi:hypothetical protein
MANLNTTVSILALSLLAGTATLDLNVKDKGQSTQEVSIVENTNGTMIDDFSQEIYSWWKNSDEKFALEREDEMLKVTVKSAGADKTNPWDCFGRQFDEMDLTKTPVIKMKVKSDKPGKMRVYLKDANGMVTNAIGVDKQLPVGDFKEVYFDLTGKWSQSWPDKQTVDPAEIGEMLIFINGGGPEFKGTIYIDDVEAVAVSEMPK